MLLFKDISVDFDEFPHLGHTKFPASNAFTEHSFPMRSGRTAHSSLFHNSVHTLSCKQKRCKLHKTFHAPCWMKETVDHSSGRCKDSVTCCSAPPAATFWTTRVSAAAVSIQLLVLVLPHAATFRITRVSYKTLFMSLGAVLQSNFPWWATYTTYELLQYNLASTLEALLPSILIGHTNKMDTFHGRYSGVTTLVFSDSKRTRLVR